LNYISRVTPFFLCLLCAGCAGSYQPAASYSSQNVSQNSHSGIDPNAEFEACIERERPSRQTASCANTLFDRFAAEPSHPLKPAKLRFAASLQQALLFHDKGGDREQLIAAVNMAVARLAQDAQNYENAEIQSQRAADANNREALRAFGNALSSMGNSNNNMMSPEEIRERQTTRKSMLNDNYLFCQNIDKNTFSCRDNR